MYILNFILYFYYRRYTEYKLLMKMYICFDYIDVFNSDTQKIIMKEILKSLHIFLVLEQIIFVHTLF